MRKDKLTTEDTESTEEGNKFFDIFVCSVVENPKSCNLRVKPWQTLR